MACIKSASRSASLAFSPDAPYLAAGTMAGAVDLSFSSSANLDIFKLDFQSPDPTLPVVAECPSTERFNRLSWGKTGSGTQEFSMGLIAGGLVDGTINIWNPLTLINMGDSVQALVGRLQKHMGPVRGLEFNVNQPNLLASGADEGELCIWDLSKPLEPSHFPPLKGVGSGAQGEVSFLSWNPKVQHILASTSYNGTTVVWDLKRQKPVLSLSDSNRKRSSVLQWNPDISTQLIVASDDDTSPTLRVWDMRNTISPLKEFVGHTKGVIAMSWCPNDSAFLLTCAKDNRTICWDTSSGEIVCELPARTNWNFDIHWYPKIPGVISASSFDGKIGIYNIEACSRLASGDGDFPGAFSASGTSVHLRAPKWLKRSSGVSFGFGGRLVTFGPSSAGGASPSCSEVYLHTVVTEQSLVTRSAEFESSIRNREKSALRDLCDKKSQESISEDDRETWGFLKVMFDEDGNARTKLLTHLGFNVPTEVDNAVLQDIANVNLDENNKADSLAEKEENVFSLDNGEEFFNNLESPKADRSPAPSGETLVAEVDSSVNGVDIQKKSDAVSSNDTSFELDVQNALVVGNYKGAVLQCISSKRMADALVIAHMGGTSLWNETRDQYLKMCHTSYLKIVAAMVNNDLMSLVNTRPLSSWKETLALLCTFAQREEWTLLCETLASRLMVVGNTLAATLCYICAGNVDKPVEIWVRTLKAEDDGKTYVDHLQDIMERTVILALAVEQKRFSASLSKLVEIYAELLSSQGLLATAMEYLELLGSEHNPPELQILRDRISFSVEVMGTPKTLLSENAQTRTDTTYGAEHSSQDAVDGSQHYYQLQPNVTSSSYSESGYQQPFSATATYGTAYQPAPPKQFQEFLTPTTFQPQQPQIFLPSQTPQIPQASIVPPPPVTMQQPVRSFVPAPPPVLRNVEPYQQPTLGSQLYPGSVGLASSHAAGPPPVGQVPAHHKMTHVAATSPTPMGFTPVTNLGYAQRPAPIVQPTSPTHSMQQSHPVTPAPPTVQTADTSKVSAELKPIVATLTRLFNETSEALGGGRANPAKKREIEDNSKKIGSLFAKLNSGDISPNAASKLTQLCQALDAGDFASALHLQVVLTTSDWDECNLWLAALKRMIKTRQNIRLN